MSKNTFLPALLLGLCSLGFCSWAASAGAFPGVIAGKGTGRRISNATQVVLLEKGDHTVVSVWSDYEGPLDRFALVLPVPSDVKLSDVRTLKRDAIDHLDEITAPRFHEFWEMDPCEPGAPEQEWERDLAVKDSSVNFLAGDAPDMSGSTKVAPELLLDLTPEFKDGEYAFRLFPKMQALKAYLSGRSLALPEGSEAALAQYEAKGMQMLVADVATSKVELAGARRALLSPIRFATRQPYVLPSTLGLASAGGQQELLIYVLHPTDRFEAANYPNVYPPTNVNVDPSVKERMGDFYAGIHDALLAKNPKAILTEYAWPTIKHCGEPCPNAPMKINELLTLGGDVLEEDVSNTDKNPKPADPSDAEKDQIKQADKATRVRMDEQRKEVARRQALLARNSYVVTRLHHRYDAKTLTEDIELKSAGPVKGGIGVPTGPSAEAPAGVEPAQENRLQVRYNVGYPSKKVVQCEAPQRWRWGIPPASYRGLRKTFTARDLAYKKRDRFPLQDVIKSSVPALGIAAAPPPPEEAAAPAKAAPEQKPAAKESGCALSSAPGTTVANAVARVSLLGLLAGVLLRRRRALRG
ncbi:MAG TPA: DUF2330 domain-containing protein [Polyangiaceae bacterium]|nr:DUF2330 domain-containing protein [Polyangiaceae bacterium]